VFAFAAVHHQRSERDEAITVTTFTDSGCLFFLKEENDYEEAPEACVSVLILDGIQGSMLALMMRLRF